MVCAPADFHRHRATRLRGQKLQHFPPVRLLAERDRSVGSRPMKLKAVLREIDPDHANLCHGRPFPLLAFTTPTPWHITMPAGGASTPSLTNSLTESPSLPNRQARTWPGSLVKRNRAPERSSSISNRGLLIHSSTDRIVSSRQGVLQPISRQGGKNSRSMFSQWRLEQRSGLLSRDPSPFA